ncbi:MAG: Bro-N domain-containing protein [Oscillospiraceae bacterium]|nr:Bro-N domain-containing protein [Oscillospiraceae bacterium]
MNEIQIFNHELFGKVRTVEIEGQIYFVGVDVAKALQYSDPIGAIRKRVDEEDRMVLSKKFCREFLSSQNSHLENIPNRGLTIINESGLYSLFSLECTATASKYIFSFQDSTSHMPLFIKELLIFLFMFFLCNNGINNSYYKLFFIIC